MGVASVMIMKILQVIGYFITIVLLISGWMGISIYISYLLSIPPDGAPLVGLILGMAAVGAGFLSWKKKH